MEKFMNWMSDVVAPKMEELTGNAWLSAMQKAIIKTLPMVLVGSLITIYNVLRNFIPALPVLTALRDYTFGLISLFMVFLIRYYVLELKKKDVYKRQELNIVFSGGVLKSRIYQQLIKNELARQIPLEHVAFSLQKNAPAYGGIRLAQRILEQRTREKDAGTRPVSYTHLDVYKRQILKAQGNVEIKGLIVSLNRMERGKGTKCALDEIKDLYGFPTAAIVSMEDVVGHLYNRDCGGKVVIDDQIKAAIDAYYEQYGAQA